MTAVCVHSRFSVVSALTLIWIFPAAAKCEIIIVY